MLQYDRKSDLQEWQFHLKNMLKMRKTGFTKAPKPFSRLSAFDYISIGGFDWNAPSRILLFQAAHCTICFCSPNHSSCAYIFIQIISTHFVSLTNSVTMQNSRWTNECHIDRQRTAVCEAVSCDFEWKSLFLKFASFWQLQRNGDLSIGTSCKHPENTELLRFDLVL